MAGGAALLFGLWLLWPGPDHVGHDRRQSRDRQPVAGGALLVTAEPKAAISAKRELAGMTVGAHRRMEERLLQVARTMPEIGMPEASAPDQSAAALDPAPALAPIDPMEIEIAPAAPPLAAPGAADDAQTTRIVARLEPPDAIVPPETDGQGTPTWLRHAVAPMADDRPAIALVIDDLGLNRRAAAALNQLPGPLTLAFLPYATRLDEQARAARAAGHELLVHVPMEPRGQEWPGPNALTSQLAPDELVAQLGSQLRSFRGFVGINNHMGSLLTTDPERMAIIMAELRRRGLLFLDSRTTPESVAAREAARMGVPHAARDVFIDNDLDVQSVLAELARSERIARYHGHAVAIGHPHDVTIEALRIWLATLEAREIALVPISTIVARRSCASGILPVAETCARYAVAASTVPVGQ